jgi:glycosyltransferase involved in cell wall biosynthesis
VNETTKGNRPILVDTRWIGQSGIGRYAREVTSRLAIPWQPIDPSGTPSSPTDFLFKRVTVGSVKPRAIYSPGYNGFLRNVPQTITLLDLIHLESPGSAKYRPYYEMFIKPLVKRNGHVITISETSKAKIERWLNAPRVDVINAGIGSSPEFSSRGPEFVGERPYFLYVGTLRAHKNVATVFKALRRIPDFDLYVVTADAAGVEQLAARHEVGSRVRVFSGIDDNDLAELYRGARATIQPSLLEGFGLPAMESALCGTPVIFYEKCESVKEICAGSGLAVPDATDDQLWAEAMMSIAEGQRFPPLGVSASDYSWSRVSGRISGVLERYR